jgi:hypothetical protein
MLFGSAERTFLMYGPAASSAASAQQHTRQERSSEATVYMFSDDRAGNKASPIEISFVLLNCCAVGMLLRMESLGITKHYAH